MRKAVKLSSPTPIKAKMPAGKAVRHRMMIFVVKEKAAIFNTGTAIPKEKTTASMAFLSFSIPPNSEPSLMKFGGIK